MRTMFIEARSTCAIRLPKAIALLPQRIGLFTTVQFIGQLPAVKLQLENAGKSVTLFKTAAYPGQLLGCTIQRFNGVDAFLYIGDGMFHPLALAIKNTKPVFMYNPYLRKMQRLDEERIRTFERLRTRALKKFHAAERIGILVSLKRGQCRLEDALQLKARLTKPCFILVADDFDLASLENFTFIDCFVNTLCPRISYDDAERLPKPIINIEDLA